MPTTVTVQLGDLVDVLTFDAFGLEGGEVVGLATSKRAKRLVAQVRQPSGKVVEVEVRRLVVRR